MKKIAIAGFGREGRSVLKFLKSSPEFRGSEIWVLDEKHILKIPNGIRSHFGKNYLSGLSAFDIVFRTPGIPYDLPQIRAAIKKGTEISSSTKLFFEKCHGKIIGVTGTKGKGTTSTLIYRMLKEGGEHAFLAGNIGTPALDMLPKINKRSWVVLELSSFQLMDLKRSPHIAVALMVTSEHLDWHKNVGEYVSAKAKIVRFQSPDDFAVLSADHPRSMSYARMTKANVFTFSRRKNTAKGTWVENGHFWFSDGRKKEKIAATGDLHIPGEHNWENACAAITAAKIAGVENANIARAISRFEGLEHRLEFVREVRGVRYYNDSYATTPETAEVAIDAFAEPKILILGGSHKGSDFRHLGKTISRSRSIKAIIGIGAEWPRIEAHIRNKKIKIVEGCKNMNSIVRAARAIARPGDAVLLSPACASFGMFKNYTERGLQFKALVRKLK